jgi:hypothetical protein
MTRRAKIVSISLGLLAGLFVVFAALALQFDSASEAQPIATLAAGTKRVVIYAPGQGLSASATTITSTDRAGGRLLVRDRLIEMREDGSVFVDGLAVDAVGYTELEIRIDTHSRLDMRITRITNEQSF